MLSILAFSVVTGVTVAFQSLQPKNLDREALNQYFSGESVDIIGFGSLLSETSARSTFPTLTNFRPVRIQGYRRVFRHPAFIFFERGIADSETRRYSSLSTEKVPGVSFMGVAFSIKGETGDDFIKREEEFCFDVAPFQDLGGSTGSGLICTGPTDGSLAEDSDNFVDKIYFERWGREQYETKLKQHCLPGIWTYPSDSGILPCSIYLRHCILAAKKLEISGVPGMLDSFLDETFLCDRETTIRQYISENEWILRLEPPESLVGRYSG
jgi:hypothetical protein